MPKYIATSEEVIHDREEFYSYFGQDGGKVNYLPQVDLNRVASRWAVLLQTQNGEDYDDYAVDPGCGVDYLKPWVRPPAKLMILGTGTGREILAARSVGFDAVGTTLGKKNITFAEWRLGIDPEDIFYGDNCTLPHWAESFDAVLACQVFEHCHAPYLFLFECCRILKEGGVLVLEWPPYMRTKNGSLTTLDENSQDSMAPYTEDNVHHACCWTPAQGFILTNRCGFEDVEVFIDGVKGSDELVRIDSTHPCWYSNIAPNNIILKARKRPYERQPEHARQMLSV